ncbi:hypothetical protein TNCV_2307241 [Trichonephila clavipes]|nr:hypothetical protein TNCV_2307241 [Trichonephila clavipes]
MDEDARRYMLQLEEKYIQSEDIQRLEWPTMSPDLNPIYGTSLDAQLQFEDQLQRPSIISRVPWCSCYKG